MSRRRGQPLVATGRRPPTLGPPPARPAPTAPGGPTRPEIAPVTLDWRDAQPLWAPETAFRPIGLGYLPGIDGLRALSVLAVLAYHLEASWAVGGYLGVEVFFVVSGFLITTLLLDEEHRSGRVDLLAFWRRRARRLLPAVVVLVAAVCAYAAAAGDAGAVARFRGDAVASLLYVQNWYAVFTDQPYFASFGRPSPLRHLWSLAIEEQFYLLWPLVLPAGLRAMGRRGTAVVLASAAGASVAAMAATADIAAPERAYYGTDTRLFGLLLGVLLAFAWRPGRARAVISRPAARIIDVVGLAAVAVIVQQFVVRSEFDPWTFPWGFLWVDVATLVAIVAVTHPASALQGIVGSAPLQAIGRRSYSIYLWHWPVLVFTRPGQDWTLDGPAALAARLALTAALAELSYRLVERPVRDGRVQDWFRARISSDPIRRRGGLVVALGAAAVFAVAMTSVSSDRAGVETAAGEDVAPSETLAPITIAPRPDVADESANPAPTTTVPFQALPAPATPEAAPTTTVARAPSLGDLPPARPAAGAAPGAPVGIKEITVIGESVTLGGVPALMAEWGDRVQIDAVEGRSFSDSVEVIEWLASVDQLTPTVIVHIGTNGAVPAGALDRIVEAVGYQRHLVLVNVKVPQRWESQVNDELERFAGFYDHITLADWHRLASEEEGLLVDDGVHLTAQGRTRYRDLLVARMG